MVDILSENQRSALMARVRERNTKPELAVRRLLFSLGYRFRLHRRDLPGTPDIVFPARRKVIFVHGCFWHRHKGCQKATTPKTRQEFWTEKFRQNIERDAKNLSELEKKGWQSLVVWECQVCDLDELAQRLRVYLNADQ